MIYDKPDYYHYVDSGDCPNCRHGLMWMSHGSIEEPDKSFGTCFFCGYSDRKYNDRHKMEEGWDKEEK